MTPQHTHYLSEQAARWKQIAQDQPRSKGAAFYAEGFADYAIDSEDREALSGARDSGELLDLRFIGQHADHGKLPLGEFLEIFNPINKAFNQAAYRIRSGKNAPRTGVDANTKATIGLQMAGTASGSTRVFVMGDAREDLTGVSLLESTFTQTFRLLNAQGDEFYDAVDAVGSRAARNFGEALESTRKYGLSADFSWERPEKPMRWNGTIQEIDRVVRLIETTNEKDTYEETLVGHVSAMAETGAIKLRVNGENQKIRFPLKLMPEVQRLTLLGEATLRVQTVRYFDAVLKEDVYKHRLLKVI